MRLVRLQEEQTILIFCVDPCAGEAVSRAGSHTIAITFRKVQQGMSISGPFNRHTGRRRNTMRSTRSFVTTSFAGTLLALTIATGAAPALPPIVRDVASSYRSAVRVYDRARMWGVIARWWVDPVYVPAVGEGGDSSKFENVCQVRSAGGR
jgi:hypothetical protein